MQLDKSDLLYESKLWLLERLGIAAKPIQWQKLDILAAAVAARVLWLREVEVGQLQCIENLQQPLNPRNEAAALALLVSNQSVVCGSSSQRRQQLQQLTTAYRVSVQQQQQQQQQHGQALAEGPTSALATVNICNSDDNTLQDPHQQQQQKQQRQHGQGSAEGPTPALATENICNNDNSTLQDQQQRQHSRASAEGPTSALATEIICNGDDNTKQDPQQQQHDQPSVHGPMSAAAAARQSCDSSSSRPQQQQQQDVAAAEADTGVSTTDTAAEQPCSSSSCNQPLQQQQPQQQQHKPVVGVPYEAGSPEQDLLSWVLSQGASSQVIPAMFPIPGDSSSSSSSSSGGEAKCASADSADLLQHQQQPPTAAAAAAATNSNCSIRGCAASSDLPAGSNVISLPASLLITYKTAAESDFGKVLTKIGLDSETLAVVWTMVERWDEESSARPFWQALPEAFNTGLSVPDPLVDLVKGTPLHSEMTSARQHIRQQYQDSQQTFKVLLTAYPSYLQESWFSLAKYLWAVELWYAYAIQVKFPDGTIQTALAPLVSLLNHSPWPHIVHFSTVDPETQQLHLTNFRPIKQHEQVFLSYGPLPNAQLLLFYGFTVQGNPFEELQLTLDLSQQQQQQQGSSSPAAAAAVKDSAGLADQEEKVKLLQGLGLGLQYKLTVQQPVPTGLLAALRVLHCSTEDLQAVQAAVDLAVQQQATTASAAAAVAAGSSSGASSNEESASNKGKGSNSKASKSSRKPSNGKPGTDRKVNDSSTDGNELERKWAAAALCKHVLGQPLSNSTEAAVKENMSGLLTQLRAPYEACVGKIARRRQLQAMLVQQQQVVAQPGVVGGSSRDNLVSSNGSNPSCSEDGFLASVDGYARDLIALCNACGRGSGVW